MKVLLVLAGALLIVSCGYMEGTVQKAEKSFFVFSGNLENVKVHIDDMEPFTPAVGTQYQISPGKHTLTAYREGNVLVKRVVILQNQVTTEINIP